MRRATVTAFACTAALLAAAPAAMGSAVRELGFDTPFQDASCPDNCQAIAQVTGYQTENGKTNRNPTRVGKPGWIVAFTVRLAKPSADQLSFFKTTYGTSPSVRLSIIRSLKTKHRYSLSAQSPVYKVDNYLGSTPTFVLRQPLRIHTNEIVAITVPTWLPAFAHGLASDVAWRSSHSGSDCTAQNPPAATQETIKSVKVYGCLYRTARLLYSATYVPDPTPTSRPSKGTSKKR